jgi:hypothetical protein
MIVRSREVFEKIREHMRAEDTGRDHAGDKANQTTRQGKRDDHEGAIAIRNRDDST